MSKPFKLKSGNSPMFKQMGSSPNKFLGKLVRGLKGTEVGQTVGRAAGSGMLGAAGMLANKVANNPTQQAGQAMSQAAQGGVPPHSHEEGGTPIQRNDGRERRKSILGRETVKTPKRGAKRVITNKKDKIKRKHWSGKTEKVKHKYKVIKNERGEKERVIVKKEKGGGKGKSKEWIRKGN
jgi:hypothetical protein